MPDHLKNENKLKCCRKTSARLPLIHLPPSPSPLAPTSHLCLPRSIMFELCDGVACPTTAETTGSTKGQLPRLYPTSPPLVAPPHSQAPPIAFDDPSRPRRRCAPFPYGPRAASASTRRVCLRACGAAVSRPRCSAITTLQYCTRPTPSTASPSARTVYLAHSHCCSCRCIFCNPRGRIAIRQRARRVLPHSAWRTRSLSPVGHA
jgi:hypothetical protein